MFNRYTVKIFWSTHFLHNTIACGEWKNVK